MEELIINNRELKENMVKIMNNSKLPAFIIKNTLQELFNQANLLEEQEYQEAIKTKQEKIDIAKPSKNKKEGKENGNT